MNDYISLPHPDSPESFDATYNRCEVRLQVHNCVTFLTPEEAETCALELIAAANFSRAAARGEDNGHDAS